jgi:hypothetical protein
MSKKLSLASAVLIAGVLVLPGASAAQVPTRDSATGSGAAQTIYAAFEFSASSDPGGASPTGTASWTELGFQFEGTVSCLRVGGNQAVIGIDVTSGGFQGFFLSASDLGPAGSGLDVFAATPTSFTSVGDVVPTDCSVPFSPFLPNTVTSGDIVVVDAPPLPTTKEQCKNGGWKSYGVFKNQGDCVSFVATKGHNQPSGP